MTTPQQGTYFAAFSLDGKDLTKSAINGVRIALGVSGAAALIIGLIITFWPKGAAAGIAVLLGIYLLIAGIAYLGIGIFSRGIGGWARVLDIILGIVFIVAAVLAFTNISGTAAVLAVFLGVLVGIAWIIEGVVALVQIGDARSKGWSIFFGLLSIVAGIVLLFAPIWSAVLLFILTGIGLIVLGVIQIVRAFTFGRGIVTPA
ncbi:HdeD family acid-resistance protein [Microterricola viridarii]|uniref:Acid-resistance membrane protein n=1 Tax=Microterricola viridarii TaxID=412690 RepID=A0A0X8E2K8_9MICO|nr:DUF308 domain-containing protein [Microterricola viridarii]AMB58514.1 hypothetical protein AWU67_06200 [Microterricola viridarii]